VATLLVPRDQVRAVLAERIDAGEDLLQKSAIAETTNDGHRDWNYLFARWRDHTLAELEAVYDDADVPSEFDVATRTAERSSPRLTFPDAKESLELGIWKLRHFVERLELAVEPEALQPRPGMIDKAAPERDSVGGPNVFIIHGLAAGGFRDSVARFIEQLGLVPVILAEQANEGRTIIEKFEAHAIDVGYAIALVTPEDWGHGPDEDPPPGPNRARQNVILELGYFMASLGRKNVVALLQEGVEVPTDILGILYIPLDDGGAWKTLLARELQAANYDIDLKMLLS
jgi:predicted nucleotide-binding protein